ncbi:MAG: hypothetical protein M3258_05510 [Thermoproteota archaeon]|nr:hypothetical protein [Thermoproteota archaeon]
MIYPLDVISSSANITRIGNREVLLTFGMRLSNKAIPLAVHLLKFGNNNDNYVCASI